MKESDGTMKNIVNLSREDVDKIFLSIMEKEGISKRRRNLAYRAVRVFGSLSWKET
jgi:hypothetical protein